MSNLIQVQEAERALRIFISSLRWSLDTRLLHREAGNSDIDVKVLLAVEEARIRLNRVIRSRYGMQPQDFPKVAADLKLFIKRFMDLDDLDNGSFSRKRFRLGPLSRDNEGDAPDSFLASFRDEKILVKDALDRFAYFLETTEIYLPEVVEGNGLIELERITPKQQLSPVQFKINAGKLHVQRVAQEVPVPDQKM